MIILTPPHGLLIFNCTEVVHGLKVASAYLRCVLMLGSLGWRVEAVHEISIINSKTLFSQKNSLVHVFMSFNLLPLSTCLPEPCVTYPVARAR